MFSLKSTQTLRHVLSNGSIASTTITNTTGAVAITGQSSSPLVTHHLQRYHHSLHRLLWPGISPTLGPNPRGGSGGVRIIGATGAAVVDIQKRYVSRDYDKVKKLLPESVEYKYKDSKFFGEHQLEDEPYLKLTTDEIVDLSRVKLEKDYPRAGVEPIDINAQPYRQVLADNTDNERGFTDVEVVGDDIHHKSQWFWVERLLPKRELPRVKSADRPEPLPTGVRFPSTVKPDRKYFIPRTRTRLLPVYRRYEVWDRDHKTYWRNRWDGLFNSHNKDLLKRLDSIKWPNEERTVVLTRITQITGDVWQLEEDLRSWLEDRDPNHERIMSGVMEVNGVLTLKGDYVMDCVQWLTEQGF